MPLRSQDYRWLSQPEDRPLVSQCGRIRTCKNKVNFTGEQITGGDVIKRASVLDLQTHDPGYPCRVPPPEYQSTHPWIQDACIALVGLHKSTRLQSLWSAVVALAGRRGFGQQCLAVL